MKEGAPSGFEIQSQHSHRNDFEGTGKLIFFEQTATDAGNTGKGILARGGARHLDLEDPPRALVADRFDFEHGPPVYARESNDIELSC